MDDSQKLIDEYTPDYTLFLEGTYGDHMLTEGGTVAIDKMFEGTELNNKTALDIGFGLGAAVFHLADKYHADVTGTELNPWMVEEATRRIPKHLPIAFDLCNMKNPRYFPFLITALILFTVKAYWFTSMTKRHYSTKFIAY